MEAIITVIIVLLVCIVIWYISTSNGIKRSQLKVEEAESGIDVALTKRYDVLTKMLDVVKGYQAHEKTVLTELVKLRSGMTMAEKNAANQKMEQLTKDINILAENYPELKSSNNFMELQKTILAMHYRRRLQMWKSICRQPADCTMRMSTRTIRSLLYFRAAS